MFPMVSLSGALHDFRLFVQLLDQGLSRLLWCSFDKYRLLLSLGEKQLAMINLGTSSSQVLRRDSQVLCISSTDFFFLGLHNPFQRRVSRLIDAGLNG